MKQVVFCILLFSSCANSENPYFLVNKFSQFEFDKSNAPVIQFSKHSSGIKEEGDLRSVYNIDKMNIDSLKPFFSKYGYEKLPMRKIDIGDGFNNNLKLTDSGYYKLTLSKEGSIEELSIVNFSNKKLIYYKVL